MKGGQVDSRDFYDCISHVSILKIISMLDKESSFGSIEDLLRKQSLDESIHRQESSNSEGFVKESSGTGGTTNPRELAREQLKKLNSTLKKVQIASVALIASMTKKIKQMTFFYLTDFMEGPLDTTN